MNAAEQAHTPDLACKIAQVALIFRHEFPDAKADLSPWLRDPATQQNVDPDSIDVGFNFPGRKPDCQCRSILVQIRFSDTLLTFNAQIIGIEISGHDHVGQQWRLSTVGDWTCAGKNSPTPYAQDRLKRFCQMVFNVFQDSTFVSSPCDGVATENDDMDYSPGLQPNIDLDLDPDRWEPCDWKE